MFARRQKQRADQGARFALQGNDFRASIRQWLFGGHDYAWIVVHHSMRQLHLPIRLLFATTIFFFGLCSVLLLTSAEGPTGLIPVTWTIVVLVLQGVEAVAVSTLPIPTTPRGAQIYFLGLAVFADVGLASILILYSPLVAAFGCALFVLNSALCTYFVSSRWLLAHIAWSATVIVFTAWRVYDARVFDTSATIAGGLVLIVAVCAVPVSAHLAWTLLSVDARQALLDPLTGVHNRRGIDASIEPLWRASQVAGMAIGAVAVDIDNFKLVNDTYGHDVGDRVLRQISDRMAAISGSAAIVGRTGGEEFTLILAGQVDEIVDLITLLPEHLRDATDSAPITVSVGAAVIESPREHHFDAAIRDALRTADACMYDAKRSGGGRSSISVI